MYLFGVLREVETLRYVLRYQLKVFAQLSELAPCCEMRHAAFKHVEITHQILLL